MSNEAAARGLSIDRRSIETRVADALRERFLSGDFAHGERLTEEGLARELSVSRGPIRAALQRLEREQLVVLRPYRGWEVARPTEQDAWELATLRCGLEELGCRLAAAAITPKSAERLQETQRHLIAIGNSGQRAALTEADYALHSLIMELSGNRRLHESYVQLRQQIRFLIAAVNEPFHPRNIAHSHDAMIEAICAGDGEAAALACRGHHAVMIANSKATGQ